MAEDRSIDRACGILIGVMGVLGCITPFTKKPLRDSLQMSISGIGIVLSLFTVISKTTK